MSGIRAQRIQSILQNKLASPKIIIDDESDLHAHGGNESHIKLVVISSDFVSKTRIQRQRSINEFLADEFKLGLHALSLRCLTPEEAKEQVESFQSPLCASQSNNQRDK